MRTLNKTLKGGYKTTNIKSQSSGGLVVVVPQPRFFDTNSPAVPQARPTFSTNPIILTVC